MSSSTGELRQSVLYVATYYKRIDNMRMICDAMRNTPNTMPLIICNGGEHERLREIAGGITIIHCDNKWKNFSRHPAIKEWLEANDRVGYVLNIDDDVIPQPELLDYLLRAAGDKTIVGCWGFRIRPPFDDYLRREQVVDGTECHYMGTGVTLYPADLFRQLTITEISEDMMTMDDIWLSYHAIRLGYKQLGLAPKSKYWYFNNERDDHATYIRLGFDRKTQFWNRLFTPRFKHHHAQRMEDIWFQRKPLSVFVRLCILLTKQRIFKIIDQLSKWKARNKF